MNLGGSGHWHCMLVDARWWCVEKCVNTWVEKALYPSYIMGL